MIPASIATRVTLLPTKLEQGRGGAPPGLGALAAAQTARKIVHEGGRRVFEGRQIDIVRGLATRTLDFQPGKAAVDRLVNCWGGVDRLAIAPHPLVPAFTEQPIGLLDQRSALGSHLC